MARGYTGRVLDVDLSSGRIGQESLEDALLRDFVGGYGVGARLLYDRMGAGVDPLGPQNLLGFFTGPLTGTPAIEGSRFTVACKSPLTLTWGDSNCGGTFGPHLKFAGFDGVLFSGAAERPVYLFVEEGRAELRDASHLWGLDTNETEDLLRARHGRGTHVACIGPAGEKLALIAAIINDYGRAAARSGVGAVMGSKRLKAVAVRGGLPVPLADPQRARALRASYLRQRGGAYEFFTRTGTPGALGTSAMSGDSPVKNWGGAGPGLDLPGAATKLDGQQLIATYQLRRYGCWRCTMACGGHHEVRHDGPYQGVRGHQSEYETGAMFGPNLLNDSYASTLRANEICNRYGLDTISAGAVIAWAMEAYERGILTAADTDGIELTWGNDAAIIATLERLARREGFGDLLAQGVWRASQQVGRGSEEFAIHIHGQELPAHDPRFQPGFATTYLMDATPGRHTQGGEQSRPLQSDLGPELDRYQYSGKGEVHARAYNLMHLVNAAGVCQFAVFSYPWQFIPDFMEAVTGWPYPMESCLEVGERIANVRHAFNLREGLNPLTFQVPGRMIGNPPLREGGVRGVTVDLDTQVREFCQAMGWDTVTARPDPRRLERLGLGDIARDLTP